MIKKEDLYSLFDEMIDNITYAKIATCFLERDK